MTTTHCRAPAIIALDWGTSSLRAALVMADGGVVEQVEQPWGIRHLPPGRFAAALAGVAGGWRTQWPDVPIIAAGMIGSRQGWCEVPYVECPADPAALARGLVSFDTGDGRIWIVPGVMQRGPLPNVLRGEETQLCGALATGAVPAETALVILPGTHSKWVVVEEGRLVRFETFMTGELFAVLRDHSLLGVPAREAGESADDGDTQAAAFRHGLATARDAGAAGVAGRLFTARSLVLTGELPAAVSLDYLSGLLIGEEIRGAFAGLGGRPRMPVALVGTAGLCQRYREGLDVFGAGTVTTVGDTAIAGLWTIARAAGLLDSETATHD